MSGYEITRSDLRLIASAFDVLDQAAAIDGATTVQMEITGEGGDTFTIEYGETGEPAVTYVRAARS